MPLPAELPKHPQLLFLMTEKAPNQSRHRLRSWPFSDQALRFLQNAEVVEQLSFAIRDRSSLISAPTEYWRKN